MAPWDLEERSVEWLDMALVALSEERGAEAARQQQAERAQARAARGR